MLFCGWTALVSWLLCSDTRIPVGSPDLYSIMHALCPLGRGAYVGLQVGFLVVEVGFLTSRSFPALMAIFAVGELALFAGQAPCSEPLLQLLQRVPQSLSLPCSVQGFSSYQIASARACAIASNACELAGDWV